ATDVEEKRGKPLLAAGAGGALVLLLRRAHRFVRIVGVGVTLETLRLLTRTIGTFAAFGNRLAFVSFATPHRRLGRSGSLARPGGVPIAGFCVAGVQEMKQRRGDVGAWITLLQQAVDHTLRFPE